VQKRIVSDPAFGEALLREGIGTMLAGDVDTGKAILRDYIKATVGFEKLGGGDRHAAEEPHPHVWPARQSAGPQPLRHHWLPAEAGRRRVPCQPGAWPNDNQRNSGCLMINAYLDWVGTSGTHWRNRKTSVVER
jgi:hypothetical protein